MSLQDKQHSLPAKDIPAAAHLGLRRNQPQHHQQLDLVVEGDPAAGDGRRADAATPQLGVRPLHSFTAHNAGHR